MKNCNYSTEAVLLMTQSTRPNGLKVTLKELKPEVISVGKENPELNMVGINTSCDHINSYKNKNHNSRISFLILLIYMYKY